MAGLRRRATLRRRLRDGRRKCGLDDDGRNSSTLGRSPLSSIITTYAGGLSPRRQLRLDEQQLYDLGNRPSPPLRPPPARHSASTPHEKRWSALFCAGAQPAASLHPLRTGVPWGREGKPLAQPTRFIMMTSANSLRRYYNTYHPPANSVLTFSTSSASAGSYTRGLATFLEARVPSKTPSRVGEATIFIVRADIPTTIRVIPRCTCALAFANFRMRS